MRDRTYKAGGEIIITLGKPEARREIAESFKAKGGGAYVLPKRENQYLARRKKKKGGFINFYDLGEYLHTDGETWIEDVRQLIPSIADLNTYGFDFDEIFPDSEVVAEYNKPLQIPLSEWTTRFRKISYEDAFKYRLSVWTGRLNQAGTSNVDKINTDNPNWTEEGLKIPTSEEIDSTLENKIYRVDNIAQKEDKAVFYDDDEQSGEGSHDGIFNFFAHNDSEIKVTSLPNFNAQAIDIDGINIANAEKVEVFVNPQMMDIRTSRDLPNNVDEYLLLFYSTIPKSIFFNDALRIERDYEDAEFAVDWRKAMQIFPNVRQIRRNNGIYSLTGVSENWDDPSYDYNANRINYERPRGSFLGAVKLGSNWYFYWELD